MRTLEALARIEPERVLELIQQKKVFTVPFFNGMVGLPARHRPDGRERRRSPGGAGGPGRPRVEGDRVSSTRAHKLGSQNRARALEVLDRALLNARAAKEPDGIRLLLTGTGRRGVSRPRSGRARPRNPARGGSRGEDSFPRGAGSATRAARSPKSWCRSISRPRWHSRRTSAELADSIVITATSPTSWRAAIRPRPSAVLAMVKDRIQRDSYTVRVVYRMAPLDLARARRLAGSIGDESLKGFALGMMALRLRRGRQRLRRTRCSKAPTNHSSVRPAPARRNQPAMYEITSIAGVLLPVAERIDPGLVDEYLWRSLAMRRPKPWETERTADARHRPTCCWR